MLRQRFPAAELVLVDFSEAMLELARRRMGEDARVQFVQADYVRCELPECCSVVSTLSIHHLEDADKQTLIPRVHGALRTNGVFVNADQVAGPTDELKLRYEAWWQAEVRANGATEEQIAASLYRRKEDRCAAMETQLGWMRDAGFADADCWWKNGMFAVMAGTKR
jgi:tRNA (cmo5U34)-methyltransferase